jgi:PAS domain-containing protein
MSWEPSAAYLRYAIISQLVGAGVIFVVLRLLAPEQTLRTLGCIMVGVFALIGWYFLSRGRMQATIYVLAYGVWSVVTAIAVFTGGVRAPAVIVYPVIILMMGWTVNWRAALVVTGLSLAATAGFVLAESLNYLPAPLPTPAALYGVIQAILALLSLVLIGRFVYAYQNRIKELHKVRDDLALQTKDLEATKEELHRAQAVGNIGSWIYDIANDMMRLSAETCRIFGLPEGTTESHSAYIARSYPKDRSTLESAWQMGLRTGSFDHEHRIVVGKTTRWVRQKAEISVNAIGIPLWAEGITQDVTERKMAESVVERERVRFQTILRMASDGIHVVNRDGLLVEANDAFLNMLGYDESPPRQNSCRPDMILNLGAIRTKDGTVRRSIQEQDGGAAVAAGERRCRCIGERDRGVGADIGTMA